MKTVLISIQPKWVEKIASGKKTIEVRKSRPKLETPFKCYIYATKNGDRIVLKNDRVFEISKALTGKVIGEFVCDRIEDFSQWEFDYSALLRHINLYAGTNGDYKFLNDYLKGQKKGYGWHISDLVIYYKPKDLSEFRKQCEFAYSSYEEGICYEDCIQGKLEDCRCFCLPIKRPPQSWCYVESLGE